MPFAERQLIVSDGTRLVARHFAPPNKPRAFVVALNGIQSHAGWYERSSARLAKAGIDVRVVDRRGSGRSGGLRGHAPHWERLVNDVVGILGDVRRERDRASRSAPVVLLAVSWGAKLAAVLASMRPELVDALALLYPGIHSRFRPTLLQQGLLRFAEWAGARRRLAPVPLDDPALFTSDPEQQEFIRNDPLALHRVTTGFLFADRELTREARACAPQIHCPVLLMLAGRDRITDNPATRRWFDQLGATDKRLIEYPEAAHTLEFEACFDEFVDDLAGWVLSREI